MILDIISTTAQATLLWARGAPRGLQSCPVLMSWTRDMEGHIRHLFFPLFPLEIHLKNIPDFGSDQLSGTSAESCTMTIASPASAEKSFTPADDIGITKSTRAQEGQDDLLDTSSSAWMKVPYRCNRGIVHDGDLPHLSTMIESLPPHLRRVIIGFNLFTNEVGPAAQRAPEHSSKFNATVKLYQTMAAVQGNTKKEKLTFSDIKKNKGLYRMLKLVAKKMKEKDFDAASLRAAPTTLESCHAGVYGGESNPDVPDHARAADG